MLAVFKICIPQLIQLGQRQRKSKQFHNKGAKKIKVKAHIEKNVNCSNNMSLIFAQSGAFVWVSSPGGTERMSNFSIISLSPQKKTRVFAKVKTLTVS